MGSSAPAAPTPPDPVATASAQGAANVQTATAQTALNNANQITPYGSETYAQTGTQAVTQPDGSVDYVPTYTSTQTLSPGQQALYQQQVGLGVQSNAAASEGLKSIYQTLQNPVTQSNLPALTTSLGATPTLATTFAGSDPNAFNQERDDATNAALARLQPTMDASNNALQSQLANQGVTAGSGAYDDAMLQQAQSNNDLRLGAVQTGDQEQQALYQEAANSAAFSNSALEQGFQNTEAAAAFGNQAREQSLTDQETINNASINQISALMHGGQVSNGQYQGYSAGQLGTTPISADTYSSAQLAEQNYQTEAQEAAQNNSAMFSALGGLFGMAGNMGRGGGFFGMSDRRLKRDVIAFGPIANGLPVYAFRYVWDDDDAPLTLGHMADEVSRVRPDAVHRHPSGFDMVDYGAL